MHQKTPHLLLELSESAVCVHIFGKQLIFAPEMTQTFSGTWYTFVLSHDS